MTIRELLRQTVVGDLGTTRDALIECVLGEGIQKYCLQTQTPVFTTHFTKSHSLLKNPKYNDVFAELIQKFKFQELHTHDYGGSEYSTFLYNDSSIVNILNYRLSDQLGFKISSLDRKAHAELRAHLLSLFNAKVQIGQIYLFETSGNSIKLTEVGIGGQNLTRENYSDDVLESFDYVAEELSEKDPKGRIVIINGEPGTGKTRYVRGLVQSTEKCVFVFLTPQQIAYLTNPSHIPAIMAFRSRYKHKSIVFIIEDADDLLVHRDHNNIGISQLLNTSDGIVGALMDFKFITTTNASSIQIDEALTRPGRLLKHINIGRLSPEQSLKIYKRLTQKEDLDPNKCYTLAELYAKAKDAETGFVKPKKKVSIGFH